MTRYEIHENFVLCMEKERSARGWSVDRMALALHVPPNTYRNIIYGKTQTIDIELACRMFDLTGLWMYQMTGYNSSTNPVVDMYTALTPANQKVIYQIYRVLYDAQEEQK